MVSEQEVHLKKLVSSQQNKYMKTKDIKKKIRERNKKNSTTSPGSVRTNDRK